jgi:hypothetical protein
VTRAHAALRAASRAIAALWLGAALVVTGSGAVPGGGARETTARIHATAIVAETPEAAPGAPESTPEAAARAGEPVSVGAAEIARGSEILDDGVFPILMASYAEFPSFRDYALAMHALGARLAVVRERRIVGSIDLARGAMDAAPPSGAFSPRARDYTDEPGLAALAREARTRFGAGAEVMLLLPREIDAGLFGGVARALSRGGADPSAYREIRARYLRSPTGGVRLWVDTAVRRDGSELSVDLLFDLDAIARAGRNGRRVRRERLRFRRGRGGSPAARGRPAAAVRRRPDPDGQTAF